MWYKKIVPPVFSFLKIWLVPNRISSNCDHNDQECAEGWCQCAVFGEKGDLYWLLILIPKFPEIQHSSQWTLYAAVAWREWGGSCTAWASLLYCCAAQECMPSRWFGISGHSGVHRTWTQAVWNVHAVGEHLGFSFLCGGVGEEVIWI